jgi:hypothetical protein
MLSKKVKNILLNLAIFDIKAKMPEAIHQLKKSTVKSIRGSLVK